MANTKKRTSSAVSKALKIASKSSSKTTKTAKNKRRKAGLLGQLTKDIKKDIKKVASWKVGKGQNYPQSNVWTEKADKEVVAKPVGYRWTDEGAKKVGKSANSRPTASEVEKYTGKTFRIPRKPNPASEDGSYRYIYQEKRVDKSDLSQKKKFEEGGGVDRYNLSFNYNPSVFKNEDAEKLVGKYTNDWNRNNDWDEVSFFVQGLTKEKVENLRDELKIEDVYNIEYELGRYKYAKGGGVGLLSKCCNAEIKDFSMAKTDGSVDTFTYCDNCGEKNPEPYNSEDSFMVIYWADEEMRDMGESSVEGYYSTLEEAIIKAKRLYTKQDFPAVEVTKDDEVVFHISNDYPNGEKYDKGGGVSKKTYASLYGDIVEAVMKDIKVSKEKAESIVDENETWLTDMIEAYDETDVEYLAEAITTTDEGKYAKGGGVKEIKKFKVGDKVVYTHKGKFGWEDIDEANHGGYDMGINEVTEVDYTKGEEAIKLNNDKAWVHPNHFELSDKYAKGGGVKVDYKDKLEDLVKDLSKKQYRELCFEYEIDEKDAEEMANFIGSLSQEEAKEVVQEINEGKFEGYSKGGGVEGLSSNAKKVIDRMASAKVNRYSVREYTVKSWADDMKIKLSNEEIKKIADYYSTNPKYSFDFDARYANGGGVENDERLQILLKELGVSEDYDDRAILNIENTKNIGKILGITTSAAYKYMRELESKGIAFKYGYKTRNGWEDPSYSTLNTNSLYWQILIAKYAKGGGVAYLKSDGVAQSSVKNKSEATPMWIMDAEYYKESNPKKNATIEIEKIDKSLPDRVGRNYIVKIIFNEYAKGGGVGTNNLPNDINLNIQNYIRDEYYVYPREYDLYKNKDGKIEITPTNLEQWESEYSKDFIAKIESDINKNYAKGGGVKSNNNYLVKYANTDEQIDVLQDIIPLLNKKGIELKYGTSVGKHPQTIIFDYKRQDGILRISADGYGSDYLPTFDGEEFSSQSDLKYILDNMYAKGGTLKSKAKYIPNILVNEIEIEKNGKTIYVDGADTINGLYVKRKVKYADGGETMIMNGKSMAFKANYKPQKGVTKTVFISKDSDDSYSVYDTDETQIMKLNESEFKKHQMSGELELTKVYSIDKASLYEMDEKEAVTYFSDQLKSADVDIMFYNGDVLDVNKSGRKEFDEVVLSDFMTESDFKKETGYDIQDFDQIVDTEGNELEEVYAENTYNWSYLGKNDYVFRVYEDTMQDRVFLIVSPHLGGDPRGNYGKAYVKEYDDKDAAIYDFAETLSFTKGVYFDFKDGSTIRFFSQQHSDVHYFEPDGEKHEGMALTLEEYMSSKYKRWEGDEFLNDIIRDFDNQKDIYRKGGRLTDKYKYVPNIYVAAAEVERRGKTTEIDGADIYNGIYVKKGKYKI